jgi:hypothetical protein
MNWVGRWWDWKKDGDGVEGDGDESVDAAAAEAGPAQTEARADDGETGTGGEELVGLTAAGVERSGEAEG